MVHGLPKGTGFAARAGVAMKFVATTEAIIDRRVPQVLFGKRDLCMSVA